MAESSEPQVDTSAVVEGAVSISPEQMLEMDISSPVLDSDFNGNLDAELPAQVERYLDFIDFNSSGHLFMGTSNLTGRYWNGSLWYYDNPKLAPGVVEAKAGYATLAGVGDGAFISDTAAVVGMDNGNLCFLTLTTVDSKVQILPMANAEDHSDGILSVNPTCDGKSVITSSLDYSVRLWDCETTALERCFNPAHASQVQSTAPHPSNHKLFLSASLDGNVLLWDLRCPKPASCVYRDYNNAPTAVSWVGESSENGEQFLVGVQSGEIHLRNTKTLNHNLCTSDSYERPIFRLVRNKYKNNQVAACANHSKVAVLEVEDTKIKVLYCDDRHGDFVRGLAWQDSTTFLSCGWDKAVYSHFI